MATQRRKAGHATRGLSLRSNLKGHTRVILRLSWSPRGDLLASCSVDRTVRIWNLETGNSIQTLLGHAEGVNQAAWSPDQTRLATSSFDRTIKVWDIATGGLLRTLEGHDDDVPGLDWSPDGKLLASGSIDCSIRIWDPNTGSLERKKAHAHRGGVVRVRWSPAGGLLASCGEDRAVRVWTPALDELRSLKGHSRAAVDVAWSTDGTILSSASRDECVRIWGDDGSSNGEVPTLERQLLGHTDTVRSVSFSHDGRLLASNSMDGRILFWRTDTWASVAELDEPTSGFWPPNLAFHPSQSILASLGDGDKEVRVWDVDVDAVVGQPREAAPEHFYTCAKVVLVGESGRGKTALARVLLGQPYEEVAGATHGMNVRKYAEETVKLPGSVTLVRETLLWDLAGQADYHIIHHLFLDETALGIVLFDPSNPDAPFRGVQRWHKALRRVAGEACPRLLVAGRVDVGPMTASSWEVSEVVRKYGFQSFLQTSAKTGQGIAELRAAIQESIPWDRLPRVTSPKLWHDIRDFLIERRTAGDVMRSLPELRDAFRRRRKGISFKDSEFDAALRNAQAQGLVWPLSFRSFVLLQPDLLSSYAASVVLAARKNPDEMGCVPEQDVKDARIELSGFGRIANQDLERALLHDVVELLLKREVAMREGRFLVFPSRFNRARPVSDIPPPREVVFHFEGTVEDVYATLVVRLSYSGLFMRKTIWKDTAEFLSLYNAACRFSIEGPEEGRGLISVSFAPAASQETRLTFLKFIQDHVESRALRGSVRRERLYFCPNPDCGKEFDNRAVIDHRLRGGQKTVHCPYCGTEISLDDPLERLFEDPKLVGHVKEVNARVSAARDKEVGLTVSANKETFGEFDVFLAHNHADKEDVRRVAEELRRRGLSPWLDAEQIRPGLWFQKVIQQNIQNVKTAAIFIGRSGLGDWQRVELLAFLELCVKNGIPFIPVLLPGVAGIPDDQLFLKQLMQVTFNGDVTESDALDNLEWGITGRHPRHSRERTGPAEGPFTPVSSRISQVPLRT